MFPFRRARCKKKGYCPVPPLGRIQSSAYDLTGQSPTRGGRFDMTLANGFRPPPPLPRILVSWSHGIARTINSRRRTGRRELRASHCTVPRNFVPDFDSKSFPTLCMCKHIFMVFISRDSISLGFKRIDACMRLVAVTRFQAHAVKLTASLENIRVYTQTCSFCVVRPRGARSTHISALFDYAL